MVTANASYEELVQQLWGKQDRVKAIRKQLPRPYDGMPVEMELLDAERQRLEEEIGDLLFRVNEAAVDEGWEPTTDPLYLDLGLLSLMAQTLVQIRARFEHELERNDLTPYMWLMLHNRVDNLNQTLGILGGKKARGIPLEAVPTYVLHMEYDDDSIDFQEAYSAEEADQLQQAAVDEGAIVYRHMVLPEYGATYPVFDPVRPHENRHRPISASKFDRITRLKGGEHFDLPDELRDVVIQPFFSYRDSANGDADR